MYVIYIYIYVFCVVSKCVLYVCVGVGELLEVEYNVSSKVAIILICLLSKQAYKLIRVI